MNRRRDVWLWVLMVMLAGSLLRFMFSGQRAPVRLSGMAFDFVGLVAVGVALLKQRERSKS